MDCSECVRETCEYMEVCEGCQGGVSQCYVHGQPLQRVLPEEHQQATLQNCSELVAPNALENNNKLTVGASDKSSDDNNLNVGASDKSPDNNLNVGVTNQSPDNNLNVGASNQSLDNKLNVGASDESPDVCATENRLIHNQHLQTETDTDRFAQEKTTTSTPTEAALISSPLMTSPLISSQLITSPLITLPSSPTTTTTESSSSSATEVSSPSSAGAVAETVTCVQNKTEAAVAAETSVENKTNEVSPTSSDINQPSSPTTATKNNVTASQNHHHQHHTPSILVHQSTVDIPVASSEVHRRKNSRKKGVRGILRNKEEGREDEGNREWLTAASDYVDSQDEGSDWEAPVEVDLEEAPPTPTTKRRSGKASWTTVKVLTRWMPSRPKHPWTQMAGHAGTFLAGSRGTVLKQLVSQEEKNLQLLMQDDALRPHVPHYHGNVVKDGNCYVQLQDLLCEFNSPCVMDIKMGVRTYLEEELEKAKKKPTPRRDMYQKMVSLDPDAPTEEEREQGAINKPRYMKFRDDMSSTSLLGFRIEGIKTNEGASKDFKNTRTRDDVIKALTNFTGTNSTALGKYVSTLEEISNAMHSSSFCQSHEMVGSSLLFVHDDKGKAGVWMIDFAKCCHLPTDVTTDHRAAWIPGNFEDGYLFGLDNLRSVFQDLAAEFGH